MCQTLTTQPEAPSLFPLPLYTSSPHCPSSPTTLTLLSQGTQPVEKEEETGRGVTRALPACSDWPRLAAAAAAGTGPPGRTLLLLPPQGNPYGFYTLQSNTGLSQVDANIEQLLFMTYLKNKDL